MAPSRCRRRPPDVTMPLWRRGRPLHCRNPDRGRLRSVPRGSRLKRSWSPCKAGEPCFPTSPGNAHSIDACTNCEFRYANLRLCLVPSGWGGILSLPLPGRLHRRNIRAIADSRLANLAIPRIGTPRGNALQRTQRDSQSPIPWGNRRPSNESCGGYSTVPRPCRS